MIPTRNYKLSYSVCLRLCLVTELTVLGFMDAGFDLLGKGI